MRQTHTAKVTLWVGVSLTLLGLVAGCGEPPPADPKVSGVGETTISKNPSTAEKEAMRKQRMPPQGVGSR